MPHPSQQRKQSIQPTPNMSSSYSIICPALATQPDKTALVKSHRLHWGEPGQGGTLQSSSLRFGSERRRGPNHPKDTPLARLPRGQDAPDGHPDGPKSRSSSSVNLPELTLDGSNGIPGACFLLFVRLRLSVYNIHRHVAVRVGSRPYRLVYICLSAPAARLISIFPYRPRRLAYTRIFVIVAVCCLGKCRGRRWGSNKAGVLFCGGGCRLLSVKTFS